MAAASKADKVTMAKTFFKGQSMGGLSLDFTPNHSIALAKRCYLHRFSSCHA
jgi:hypothetical protein